MSDIFSDLILNYRSQLEQGLASVKGDDILYIAERIVDCHNTGGNIYVLGNGGSAATASHMVCDLHKNTGKFLRVMALNDNIPLLTAVANDQHYADVFDVALEYWISSKDVLICISTSGNSPNVVNAATHADMMGAYVFGLIGNNKASNLSDYCDLAIHVDSVNIGVVEDVHLIINHILTEMIREL